MTGRAYYLMLLSAWRRHAPACAETHFLVVDPAEKGSSGVTGSLSGSPPERPPRSGERAVFALITADEGAHLGLENDPEAETLPHPLARTPVSERVVCALAPFGVASGDDTFTVAEKLARVNPLLRHRVF